MSAPPSSAQQPAPAAAPATPFPSALALLHAAKLALAQDNPIRLDYYVETANGSASMAEVVETKEKVLMKSPEEYTSLVQKTYKVGEDYLVLTENSIYVVSGKIKSLRIKPGTLRND